MKKFLKLWLLFGALFVLYLIAINKTIAVENPLSLQNNKFGIHILFPEEINEAASLVNSNEGKWGYVVVPIQATDKNLEKWQKFMDEAKKLHVIPIIRIATEGDYFNKTVWRKPKFEDVLDFANFLDSLNWPTKNRYVVIFNEPNNNGEWGGDVSPLEYAEMLNYAVTIFKSKSQNFFIISAGLDNAAANNHGISMNEYEFLRQMNGAVPGIFNQIDGFASHSYPNPGFSQSPYSPTQMSIKSFDYEANFIFNLSSKSLPIFITETGWSKNSLSDETIASYFKKAYDFIWSDKKIVTVAPFLLRAHAGPFTQFSLLNKNGSETSQYKTIHDLAKIKGEPGLSKAVLGSAIKKNEFLPIKNFKDLKINPNKIFVSKSILALARWLLKIE